MRYIFLIIYLSFSINWLSSIGCITNSVNYDISNEKMSAREISDQEIITAPRSSPAIMQMSGNPNEIYPQKWATGDGTVNNPWANDCIQKAYDSATTGGTIFLQKGYYQLSSTIYIEKEIQFIGEGMNSTIILTADARGFQINADDCILKGFAIDGSAQSNGNHQCINITQSSRLLLENIEVKNAGYYGLNINDSNHSIFKNIYAHKNFRHGIHSGANISDTNQNNFYIEINCYDNQVNGFDDRGGFDSKNNSYNKLECWNNGQHGIAIARQEDSMLSNSASRDNGTYGIWLSMLKNISVNNCTAIHNGVDEIVVIFSKNVSFDNMI